jgi:hypothetical protein
MIGPQRILPVLTDKKSNRYHALIRTGHRVDILDPVNLVENFFQGGGYLTLYLLSTEPGGGHEHIRHGHDDLRFFFTRRNRQGHDAADNGNYHQKQRQWPLHGFGKYI